MVDSNLKLCIYIFIYLNIPMSGLYVHINCICELLGKQDKFTHNQYFLLINNQSTNGKMLTT